jgi:hypothetical protein
VVNAEDVDLIGGAFCAMEIGPGMIAGEGQALTDHERDGLWRLFQEIGRAWECAKNDSLEVHSSWVEFVEAKSTVSPSYTGEYSSAVLVCEDLVEVHGDDGYRRLFFDNGIPPGPPMTRLAHAKRFVVDEFITVQIVAGGFKSWGDLNYKGFVGGSRFNIQARVKTWPPDPERPQATQ